MLVYVVAMSGRRVEKNYQSAARNAALIIGMYRRNSSHGWMKMSQADNNDSQSCDLPFIDSLVQRHEAMTDEIEKLQGQIVDAARLGEDYDDLIELANQKVEEALTLGDRIRSILWMKIQNVNQQEMEAV